MVFIAGTGMAETVSDFIVGRLKTWGVERVYGYSGDGINGMMNALRDADAPRLIQARHEELAAFMASAHAKFTDTPGVCVVTSGPGGELHMWYKNHRETVLCIEGEGSIEDLTEGGRWDLEPGVLYALDKHQQHILRSEKGMTVICCFTPSLVGPEDHDEQGSYPLLDDDGSVIQH